MQSHEGSGAEGGGGKGVMNLHLGQRAILYSCWKRRMRNWERHENIMLLKSGLSEKEKGITK